MYVYVYQSSLYLSRAWYGVLFQATFLRGLFYHWSKQFDSPNQRLRYIYNDIFTKRKIRIFPFTTLISCKHFRRTLSYLYLSIYTRLFIPISKCQIKLLRNIMNTQLTDITHNTIKNTLYLCKQFVVSQLFCVTLELVNLIISLETFF